MQLSSPKVFFGDGVLVDAFNFTADDLPATLMARQFSRINRWAGAGSLTLSDAQHTLALSYLVEPRLAKAALLHEVPELFIGDVPRPVKRLCPDLQKVEDRIILQTSRAFGVPLVDFEEILEADEKIARDEAAVLFALIDDDHPFVRKGRLGVVVVPMTAEEAADAWTRRFYELFIGGEGW